MSDDTPLSDAGRAETRLTDPLLTGAPADEPVVIELSDEDTAVAAERPHVPLLVRLRRPWPRPVIAVVAALVAAVATAAVMRPDPPAPTPPTVVEDVGATGPVDTVLTDKGWIATDPNTGAIIFDPETEANNKLGVMPDDTMWAGSAAGGSFPGRLGVGKYDLRLACVARVEYVSMRFQLSDPAGDFFFEADLSCDGPPHTYRVELSQSATLDLKPMGPTAMLLGYAFWVKPAK